MDASVPIIVKSPMDFIPTPLSAEDPELILVTIFPPVPISTVLEDPEFAVIAVADTPLLSAVTVTPLLKIIEVSEVVIFSTSVVILMANVICGALANNAKIHKCKMFCFIIFPIGIYISLTTTELNLSLIRNQIKIN